jgi:hypothetical protein
MTPIARPPVYTPEQKYHRKEENLTCEEIAEREGDRLLKMNDKYGAEIAYRIAGLFRLRRESYLEQF